MNPSAPRWPVDAHVHFHALARVPPTLEAAARHFSAAGGRSHGFLGALLLAQSQAECVFEELASLSSYGQWTLEPAEREPETLIARAGDAAIAVVCGRQVRARNGLEVLALGTRAMFPDGMPFDEAVAAVHSSGAVPVLPWGFGKWLGERGRQVREAALQRGPAALLIGDNGSRLQCAGVPRLVRELQQQGFKALPGTDPFPFAGGYRRVGGFGFLAGIEPSLASPWRDLRAWLAGEGGSPCPYGRATGVLDFLISQTGIQLYNRLPWARKS